MFAASVQYEFRESGKCAIPITNQSECSAAAMYLKNLMIYFDDQREADSRIRATSSVTETLSTYPSGCYYNGVEHKPYMNMAENSLIPCSIDNACICKSGGGVNTVVNKLALGGSIAVRPTADATLTNNIVIKEGSIVFLDGGGMTLTTGTRQFKVEREARLCMYNFRLIDGKVAFSFQVVRL